MKEVLRKKLGLTESEWTEMMDHLREYCHLSDAGVILVYGKNADVDAIIDRMTDAEFEALAMPILQKMMEDLKIKKKKAKKQKLWRNKQINNTKTIRSQTWEKMQHGTKQKQTETKTAVRTTK
mgnify:CR=1 FL=1